MAALPSFRTAVRTSALLGVGGLTAYTGYRYYQTTTISFTRAVHAESPPSDAQATLKKLPWKGFTELKLESAEMVNHNVKKLTFALPESDNVTGLAPVTSLLTQHTPEGSWIPVFRPYTPISDPGLAGAGTVTFLVKRYPNGKGSGKMHSLVPGDTMKFKPLHEFDYTPNQYAAMLFVAGGSGITPIYQLTTAILNNPDDRTKISLVYANNSERDVLLESEFDALAQKYPDRFRKVFTVSQITSGDTAEGAYERGYVTKEMIAKVWPAGPSSSTANTSQKVLVSGPPAMIESIAGAKGGFGWTQGSIGGILKELGYTSADVHKF